VESTALGLNPRGVCIIPESDLYRLIMRSKVPAAEKFQDWVTEEVLPLIRKTGSFNNPVPQMSPEEVQEVVVFYTQHQRQLIEKETDNQC
jgi:prophage antirepressor-like protein